MTDIYDALTEALRSGGPAPEGVTFDPRAPQGVTIADPAQQDAYLAHQGRLAAGVAQQGALDASAANQLRMLGPLLQQVHGLDPQLQGFLLSRLGMPGAPKVGNKREETLQNQLTLAGYKNDLGQQQRDISNMLNQAKHDQTVANNTATTQNMRDRIEVIKEQLALAQAKSAMPVTSEKTARQAVIDAYAAGERDPNVLASIAQQGGYSYGGGTRSTFMGVEHGDLAPRLGRLSVPKGASAPQEAQAPAQRQASGATPPGAAPGEVVVEKNGQRFAISPSKLQAALKQKYKLVQQ